MDTGKKYYFSYIVAFIVALIIWGFLNLVGIQEYVFYEEKSVFKIAIKILHLLFLYFILYIPVSYFISRKQSWVKHAVFFTVIYLIVAGTFMVLVYPGTWSWDDVFIYTSALNYNMSAWQHFLSSIFHMLCLQTVPIAGGVVIVQVFLAALITGFCVGKLGDTFNCSKGKRVVYEILLFFPCIFPPLLIYIFSGFRMGIYSYLELLLLIKLYLAYTSHLCISKKQVLDISLLTIVIASWRTEGLYYIFVLVLFYFVLKKKARLLWSVLSVCMVLVSVVSITKYNNFLIGNNNYSITATIVPIVAIIDNENLGEEDRKAIDKVVNIDFVKEYQGFKAEELYFMGMIRSEYNDKQYKDYLRRYAKLVTQHPSTALRSMSEIFYAASGLGITNGYTLQRTVIANTSGGALQLYNTELPHAKAFLQMKAPCKFPVDMETRNKVIRLLCCTKEDGSVNKQYIIFWNLCIPLVILLIGIFINLSEKRYGLLLLMITVLLRAVILFMTSCAPYIMYYLSVYLISYVLGIFSLLIERK